MNTRCYLPYIFAGAAGAIVASLTPLLVSATKAETKLLPFQGRLTDATGAAIADGAKVVEFKMYDAPTGGSVKWAGEVHKLSVNGGLVNTMLGSKASLGSVDFSTPTYLQITVDAQAAGQPGNGIIDAADPPLLPRQSVIASVYASVAGQMQYVVPASEGNPAGVASSGWEAVFDNGNPKTGKIPPGKLAVQSVDSSQILDKTINLEDFGKGVLARLVPSGVVMPWMGSGNDPSDIPEGWVLCNGKTIGNAQSGADYANGDARYLFRRLWNSVPPELQNLQNSDGSLVPITGRGQLADSDFDQGRKLVIPDLRGRVIVGAGLGAGKDEGGRPLTERSLGQFFGEEKHLQSVSELAAHVHSIDLKTSEDGEHTHKYAIGDGDGGLRDKAADGDRDQGRRPSTEKAGLHSHKVTGDTKAQGTSAPFNIVQPSYALTYIIKL